jgi:hypothetical protein
MKQQQPREKGKRRGRPRKPANQPRRLRESREGRLKFLPGDEHALDDQLKEARNYRYLLIEQINQLQQVLAELEQLDSPGEQISQEEQALQAFLWEH